MYKKTLFGIIGFVVAVTPFAVAAQTDSSVQTQIQSLLTLIARLQEQVAELRASASGTSVGVTPPLPTACVNLTYNLKQGDTDALKGGEVSRLQQFLTDAGFYKGGISGHVGSLTIQAVKAWQRARSIASSGDAASTGYGYVGPATRAAMWCKSPEKEMVRWDPDQAEREPGVNFTLGLNQTARTDEGDTSYFDVVLTSISTEAERVCVQLRGIDNRITRFNQTECFSHLASRTVLLQLDQDERTTITIKPEILGKDRASFQVMIASEFAQPATCAYRSNSTGKSDGIVFSPPQTSDNCRALCTTVRNEKYGMSDSGLCTFTGANGFGSRIMSIVSGSGTAMPAITLTAPNGGESFVLGEVFSAKWKLTGKYPTGTKVCINLTNQSTRVNNVPFYGGTGTEHCAVVDSTKVAQEGIISGQLGQGHSTGWLPLGMYKVRAFTTQSTYNPSFDVFDDSDSAFSIVEAKKSDSITVTAPNGGEVWEVGTMNTITWSPYSYYPTEVNPPSQVTAYLVYPSSGGIQREYKIIPSGKASIHWEGDISAGGVSTMAQPGTYTIRVVNNVTGASDTSDRPFTIVKKSVDLKINGSDGPLTLDTSKPVTLSWTAPSSDRCEIHNAYPDSSRLTQIGSVSSSGSRTAYLHTGWGPTLYCYRGEKNVSDSVTVNPVTTEKASVRVDSPNGGEKVPLRGNSYIRWTEKGLGPVDIALYMNDKWLGWINNSVTPDGAVTWDPSAYRMVTENYLAGNVFKIYITGKKSDGSGYVDDKSDAPFSITSTDTDTAKATYRGYLDDSLFITTANITEAEALANCKTNATSNPKSSIRCTWGDKEIYSASPAAVKMTVSAWLEDPTGKGKETFAYGDQLVIKWSAAPASDLQTTAWTGFSDAPLSTVELRPYGNESAAGTRIVRVKDTGVFPHTYTWNVTKDGLYGDVVKPGRYYVYVNVPSKAQGGYVTGIAGPISIIEKTTETSVSSSFSEDNLANSLTALESALQSLRERFNW